MRDQYICVMEYVRDVCSRGVIIKLGIGFFLSALRMYEGLETLSMHVTKLASLHHLHHLLNVQDNVGFRPDITSGLHQRLARTLFLVS